MGEPITGSWGRVYTAPYSSAAKWGTGINPIHQYYGSDPLRVYGRNREMPDVHMPALATPGFIERSSWGYQAEDIAGLDVFALGTPESNWAGVPFVQDGWPGWDQETPQTRASTDPHATYPVGSPGIVASDVRARRYGPADDDIAVSNQVPTETVSEGWVNKPASGFQMGTSGDDVIVSDPAQYERQTSMQQRTKTLNNDRAVARDADTPRESIASRIIPMKLKKYSEEQRHYDMFPRQMDDIPRPFWFRRAATGPVEYMEPQAWYTVTPIQRTPPPDPALGPQEIALSGGDYYGYTTEDSGWY